MACVRVAPPTAAARFDRPAGMESSPRIEEGEPPLPAAAEAIGKAAAIAAVAQRRICLASWFEADAGADDADGDCSGGRLRLEARRR